MKKVKIFLALHILLAFYAVSGICSKLASQEPFLSVKFCIYYGILLFILMFYAVMWQQILKRMDLVTAYANKSVTIIWGLIWGTLLFNEMLTPFKVIGVVIIIIGVYLVISGEEKI